LPTRSWKGEKVRYAILFLILVLAGCTNIGQAEADAKAAVVQNAPTVTLATAIIDDTGKIIQILAPGTTAAKDAKTATVIVDSINGVVHKIATMGAAVPLPATK